MTVFVDYAPVPYCCNPDSYGEVCVKCNRCGRFGSSKKKTVSKTFEGALSYIRQEEGGYHVGDESLVYWLEDVIGELTGNKWDSEYRVTITVEVEKLGG